MIHSLVLETRVDESLELLFSGELMILATFRFGTGYNVCVCVCV